jgi:ABC-type transport system, involved in lipoprotein release, permease component
MKWRLLLLRKDWQHNKIRNTLSVLSILLGVAMLVATIITAASTKSAFLNMANAKTSGAKLLARTNGEQLIREASFTYQDDAIKDALPMYEQECYFEQNETYHTLSYIAVDFKLEKSYDSCQLLSGSLPQKGECLITEDLAKQYHLEQGDKLSIRTSTGSFRLVISGVMKTQGIAMTNLGKCIFVDINNASGYGILTYKLMLEAKTDTTAEKGRLADALQGKYIIEYPEGQTEELQSIANMLFKTMMGFGLLALLLGGFLINITVNDFVRRMRPKLSTLKVLGAVKGDIMKLILVKSLITGLAGSILGIAAGIGGSYGLIQLTGYTLGAGSLQIDRVIHGDKMLIIVFITTAFCTLISIPAAIRASKESILDGYKIYDSKTKLSKYRIIYVGILFAFCIFIRVFFSAFTFSKIVTFLAVISGIYWVALIIFLPYAGAFTKVIERFWAFHGFSVRNNLMKNSMKSVNIVVLLAFVIAISFSISLVVIEISNSITQMEKGQYYGDAIVSSVTGGGFDTTILTKISNAPGVEKTYPNYQKNLELGDDNVKMIGFQIDSTSTHYLQDYWNIKQQEVKLLNTADTIILSKKIMDNRKLDIGDSIKIETGGKIKRLQIVGEYENISNNGKTGIVSDKTFLDTFRDYSIRAVNVIKKSGLDYETLKSNITDTVADPFIQIDSASEIQRSEASNGSQFIIIINCMIVVMVFASTLMLINSISMNIKNNQYSITIIKLLGATNADLLLQNSLEGILFGLFGAISGVIAGIILDCILTNSMNHMTAWNLHMTIPVLNIFIFSVGYIMITVLAEVFATAINYNSNDKAAFIQE